MEIEINTTKCRLVGSTRIILKLRTLTRIRHPNAYHLRMNGHVPRGWDGFNYNITDAGYFSTGILDRVHRLLTEMGEPIILIDNRPSLPKISINFDIPNLTPFPHQVAAVKSVLEAKLGTLHYPSGLLDCATNSGKTYICAAIAKSVPEEKVLLLLNQSDLYNDALVEMEKFLGPGQVGYMRGNDLKWGNFMVCMVPTLANRLKVSTVQKELLKYKVVLFDECDTATSKTSTIVVSALWNAPIKIGLSGSINKHKDKNKNLAVEKLFGPVRYIVTNEELIAAKVSSPLKITILDGSKRAKQYATIREEYDGGIIKCKARNTRILKKIIHAAKAGGLPLLIICKEHRHLDILYKRVVEKLGLVYRISKVHHKTPDRSAIQKAFASGEIDILVGTYILKRGKNFPSMKTIINASAGASVSTVLQIIGRALRRSDTKEYTRVYDFEDSGKYLKKHSRVRINTYKKDSHEVTREDSKGAIIKIYEKGRIKRNRK